MTRQYPVVSDSSPLIALERIGLLSIVPGLCGRVVVSPAVASEVFGPDQPPSWIDVLPVALDLPLPTHLGTGERETIALALQLNARKVILDDLPARRLAVSRDLPVMGTVALLLAAKKAGAIGAIAPVLGQLLAAGFRLARDVQLAALRAAGEA